MKRLFQIEMYELQGQLLKNTYITQVLNPSYWYLSYLGNNFLLKALSIEVKDENWTEIDSKAS